MIQLLRKTRGRMIQLLRKARRMFSNKEDIVISLSAEELAKINEYFFDELGVKHSDAMKLYNDLADQIGIDTKDKNSMYRPAWAALKLSGFNPRYVLELGTYMGYSALYLAMLFPEATVYTVELPPDDPMYQKFHQNQEEYEATLKKRLERNNIISIRMNTMNLLDLELPDFDLIFIDAGHAYPSVAFDHFFCMHKLFPGGWLFSDDAIPSFDPVNKQVNAVYQTIEYINARQKNQFRFLLQREDPARYARDAVTGKRKYIAFIKKS